MPAKQKKKQKQKQPNPLKKKSLSPSSKSAKPKSAPSSKTSTSPKARSLSPPSLMQQGVTGASVAPASAGARFERGAYELPVMDLGEAVELATALLEVKPSRPTPPIAEDLAQMSTALGRAKVALRTSRAGSFDVEMDRAWTTFVRRIQDHAELPAARHPSATLAAKVHGIIHDLSILKLNYLAEFAQIGARLDSLKREGLLHEARTLAGESFLDEVLHCHGQYGEALGVADSPADASDSPTKQEDRGEARLRLIEAIAEYTYQVLALARAGRPEGWKVVHDALAPIGDLRARQAKELIAMSPPPRILQPHPPVIKPTPTTLTSG